MMFSLRNGFQRMKGGLLMATLLLLSVFCVSPILCFEYRESITDELKPLIKSAFMILKPVEEGAIIEITCATDLHVPKGSQFLWFDSDSNTLSDVTNEYTNTTEDHRNVTLKLMEDTMELYVYCVDPVTSNVLKSMKLQQLTYRRFFKTKNSSCALHDDYWTVLTCRDMFIPPSQANTCQWTYTPFGEEKVSKENFSSEVLVLGGDVFEALEGKYVCRCSPTHQQYVLMNFNVQTTKQENGRELGNFHFCRHFLKKSSPKITSLPAINGGRQHLNGTDASCSGQARKINGLTAAVVIFGLISLVYISLTIFLIVRKKCDTGKRYICC